MYHVFQDLVQQLELVVDLDVQSETLLSDEVEQLLDFGLYRLLVSVNVGPAGFIAGPWV